MDFAQTLFFFLVTLGVLITLHELGHFLVARASGVHVTRFAIGFGPTLIQWLDRRGTEFALCAIPLGGYVRMLDEREPGYVSQGQRLSFNRLSVGWRIAIALGGPVANFLLALTLYWALFVVGTDEPIPVIAPPAAGTPAALAGVPGEAEIVAIDGRPTQSWPDVSMALADRLGETGHIDVAARVSGSTLPSHYSLAVKDWQKGVAEPDLLRSLGLLGPIPPVVGQTKPGSPAALAGFKSGDRMEMVNGIRVTDWSQWVSIVQAAPGRSLQVDVRRGDDVVRLNATPDAKRDQQGHQIGFLGIEVKADFEQAKRLVRYGPIESVSRAAMRTWRDVEMTYGMVKKILSGLVSTQALSGPITIAQVAKASASAGWSSYITILAMLSVSLGVLNLLPIPVLDGGHVLYCLAEFVRGKPLSERVQIIGLQTGLVMVIGLMCLAVYNDLLRLF